MKDKIKQRERIVHNADNGLKSSMAPKGAKGGKSKAKIKTNFVSKKKEEVF